jgi:DNA replication protein DnaC
MEQAMEELMKRSPKLRERMQEIDQIKSNALSGKTERYRILNATSDCPYNKCNGSGWMFREDTHYHFLPPSEKLKTDHTMYVECECNKERKARKELESTLRYAKIPDKFMDAAINNFDLTKYELEESRSAAAYAKRISVKYVEQFEKVKKEGKGIYFYSRTKGSGKTRLAISIANALLKKYKVTPLYKPAAEIFSDIQSTFDSDKSTTQVVNAFKEAKLLIIDDIGVEESSSRKKDRNVWKERMMNEILEYRMNNHLITFFTANIPISELNHELLYPLGRVQSRVNKMAYEVQMPEESVRDHEAKEENNKFEQMLLG